MNLLKGDWIPVQFDGQFKRISLKRLLCEDKGWQLSCTRDDMELATLQLAVCLVQVVFIPEDEDALLEAWETPMDEAGYERGIQKYLDWFDLLHAETPFMQKADIKPGKLKKGVAENWASLQKLFIGLPERSSGSETSNAFFNKIDEIETTNISDVAVALFQQATNGLSFGSHFYSVGLKGSMPLTTLIQAKRLRKCIWNNVLSKKFLLDITGLIQKNDKPTWVVPPISNESAHTIGLLRGLFWQPAKIKLIVKNNQVTGFLKETGACNTEGHWLHPHTPIDMLCFQKNKKSEKPFLTASRDFPLWTQMMGYFFSHKDFSPTERKGYSRALVVRQYQEIWREEPIHLAIGGYVKGGSAESLIGRKHELFSLSSGWKNQQAEIHSIISIGLNANNILNHAVNEFGKIAIEKGAVKRKESRFKSELKKKAKREFFSNSEELMHTIFRNLNFSDMSKYKSKFSSLSKMVFENIILPYEHDPKILPAIIESRALLGNRLKSL